MTDNAPSENSLSAPRPAPRKRFILGGLLLAGLAAALGLHLYTKGRISTDDAFVDGHVYTITPRIAGFIVKVAVEDNQRVQAGQPLVELDPTDYEVALAQARADLASAEAQLIGLSLGVPLQVSQTSFNVAGAKAQLLSLRKSLDQVRKQEEAARQNVAQAQARAELAVTELARQRRLRADNVVAQAELDTAETTARTTKAQVQAAQASAEAIGRSLVSLAADLDRLQANVDLAATGREVATIKTKDVQAQEAKVDLARERVRQAELNLGYTKIVSPVDGLVTRRRAEPGQLAGAGQPLLAVVPLDPRELWVTANYKETQLTGVRPGQPVTLQVDTYPNLELQGSVESIMAGTGAAFSLFPPENASGNYVKVVQRIPVKIVFRTDQKLPELRLGMSVVPTIRTAASPDK